MNKKEAKKYLCIDCSHKSHYFESFIMQGYAMIDGKKYISYTRSPSRKVICGDCGLETNQVFELAKEKRRSK